MNYDLLKQAIKRLRPVFHNAKIEAHPVSDGQLFVSAEVRETGPWFSTINRVDFFIPAALVVEGNLGKIVGFLGTYQEAR